MRWPSIQPLCVAVIAAAILMAATAQGYAETQLDPIAPRLVEADPSRGKNIFLQCRACHVAEPGAAFTVGPNLWGVVGRPVADRPGYPYSESLRAIDGDWTYEKLSRYLFDPKAMAPDGRMNFEGIKRAQERADLIAYLRTLGDQPVALPEVPQAADQPRYGGLPEGEGREAVYFTCRACHSLDQFTDRTLSGAEWDALLDEMVAKNGMAAPEDWARRLMIDYLSTHFGEREQQDWAGLPPGPGREEVFYTCKACHSLKMVTQQGLSRDRWDEALEWMVEEQGMEPIDDVAVRNRILDYLAEHFGSG